MNRFNKDSVWGNICLVYFVVSDCFIILLLITVADNFVWREDSSGSEADAPHYPLDLRLAEAR